MSDTLADSEIFYRETVLARSRAPRHAGAPPRIDATGHAESRLCGDSVDIFLMRDAQGALARIGFSAEGCAISIAAADLLAEALTGRTPAEAEAVARAFRAMLSTGRPDDTLPRALHAFAGLAAYPARRGCALLPWQALAGAFGEGAWR